eukprot:30336_1
MATINALTVICTMIACFCTMLGIVLIIKMIQLKFYSKQIQLVFLATFITILFYTTTIIINLASFIIHLAKETTIQHRDNDFIFLFIDECYPFFYITAMMSMLFVFLLRIEIGFTGTIFVLPKHMVQRIRILIVITLFLGFGATICDIISTDIAKIFNYVLVVFYMPLLLGLSVYLLRFFNSRIKQLHMLTNNENKDINDHEFNVELSIENNKKLELYQVSIKITVIAYIAIVSTFILTTFAAITDMILQYVKPGGIWMNDLQYLTRVFLIIDAVIGSVCMYLQIAHTKLYKHLCGRIEYLFFVRRKDTKKTTQNIMKKEAANNEQKKNENETVNEKTLLH